MKAIETVYNGYRFRSRLEARWAVFFDTLGVRYQYEPEGFVLGNGTMYLPDFWLPDLDAWMEIKGKEPTEQEQAKMGMLSEESGKVVYVFFGEIGIPVTVGGARADYEVYSWAYYPDGWDDFYCWTECPNCGAIGIEYQARSDRLKCKQNGCQRSRPDGDRGHNGDSERIVEAFTAARQARFEHGENR